MNLPVRVRWRFGSLSLTSRLILLLLAVGLTPLLLSQLLALRAYHQRIVNTHLDAAQQAAIGKVDQLEALLTTRGIALDELGQDVRQDPAALESRWVSMSCCWWMGDSSGSWRRPCIRSCVSGGLIAARCVSPGWRRR
jgi:hypothetical protein